MTDFNGSDGLERRLAAILAADVVGYSALVDRNEESTIRAVQALWSNIVGPTARKAGGRVVKTMGDGVLAEFPSAVKAVQCAMSLQEATAAGDTAFPDGIRLTLRIGLHLGDVVIDGNDILGDGVNLAARLEGLADPGGLCISAAIRDQLTRDLAKLFTDCGEQQVINISRPVHVFVLGTSDGKLSQPEKSSVPVERKPTIALGSFKSLAQDDTTQILTEGCQQTTAAFLSSQTGLKLVSPNASPDYVAEASFQSAGTRYRCLFNIVEKQSETPIQSNRLDGELDDIFQAQDQLSGRIATSIRYAILENEAEKAARSDDRELTAEQRLARAGQLLMGANPADWKVADELLDHYIAERPDDFMALTMKVCVYLQDVICGVCTVPDNLALRAKQCLDRARELNEQSDFFHLLRSTYLLGVDYDLRAALRSVNRSLDISPEYVLSLNFKGLLSALDGRPEDGIAAYETIASTMSTHPIFHRVVSIKAFCHFALGDYEAAAEAAQLSLEQVPEFPQSLCMLASSATLSGQNELGRDAMASLLTVVPDLTKRKLRPYPFKDQQIWENYCAGLATAGLPD